MRTAYLLHRRVIAYMLAAFAILLVIMALVSATWAEGSYQKGLHEGRHHITMEVKSGSSTATVDCRLSDGMKLECQPATLHEEAK